MLIITPKHISDFTKCPARTWKDWISKPAIEPERLMTENIIKAAYLHYAKKEKPTTWRQILSWTQTDYVHTLSKISINEYEDVKGILSRLSIWYDKCFLGDSCEPGIANIPVSLALGNDCYFKDQIPILGSKTKIRIYAFYHADKKEYASYFGNKIYNDVKAQARIWAFEQATDINIDEYVQFVIGPEAIKSVRISIDNKLRNKNNKNMKHILQGIKDQITYPSFSEQCNSCPYKQRCSY